MNISPTELRRQFDHVAAGGWNEDLAAAAVLTFPAGEFDAAILFAIGSRETNWAPRWMREPGDNGNGFGPMQIDKRSFPEWVASGAWRDPKAAILKGAEVLRSKLEDTIAMQGKPISLKSRGRVFTVTGAVLLPLLQYQVAIAAYNCGRWAHYHVSKGRSPDHGTTGGDYSADVLYRADLARPWFPAPNPATGAEPELDPWTRTWKDVTP